jgi:hypothetical protein
MDFLRLSQAIRHGTATRSVSLWAMQALREVAEGQQRIAAIRHPLGFICLPMLRTDEQGVCVHLWSAHVAQAQPTTSQVHAHSWDLFSYVLFGQIRNEVVSVRDVTGDTIDDPMRRPELERKQAAADEPGTYRVFEVLTQGDVDEIRATPRLVRCRTVTAKVSFADDTYSLPAGEFHATVMPAALDAATVAVGQTRAGSADLSLGGLDTSTHRLRRQRCGDEETTLVARMIAGRLSIMRSA